LTVKEILIAPILWHQALSDHKAACKQYWITYSDFHNGTASGHELWNRFKGTWEPFNRVFYYQAASFVMSCLYLFTFILTALLFTRWLRHS
jgi:hypothetical protein